MAMAIAVAGEASEVKKVGRTKGGGTVTLKGNTFEEVDGGGGVDNGGTTSSSGFQRNKPHQKTVWSKPN